MQTMCDFKSVWCLLSKAVGVADLLEVQALGEFEVPVMLLLAGTKSNIEG